MKTETDSFYKDICKGDLKAFEYFYKKYQPRLFAYGVGILGDEEASKDLVQETFIAFWENKERLVTYYSVSSYLFKIFQSKCLSYLRKRTLLSDFSSLSELKLKEIEMSYYSSDNIITNKTTALITKNMAFRENVRFNSLIIFLAPLN